MGACLLACCSEAEGVSGSGLIGLIGLIGFIGFTGFACFLSAPFFRSARALGFQAGRGWFQISGSGFGLAYVAPPGFLKAWGPERVSWPGGFVPEWNTPPRYMGLKLTSLPCT